MIMSPMLSPASESAHAFRDARTHDEIALGTDRPQLQFIRGDSGVMVWMNRYFKDSVNRINPLILPLTMYDYGANDIQYQANAANYENKLWRSDDLHNNETLH